VVTVTVRDGAAFERGRGLQSGRWGMAFGTGALADREEDRVPTLTLWADADAIGEDATARLREAWSALLARAMDAGGAQGVLLRSGWTPAMPEHTAYETACGIDGRATTTRAWVARWVRVPGNDRLWLGPALAARLGAEARARLAEIADVEARSEGLAIALREPAQAGALEEALAELLPSEQEAHAANAAWYAAARKE
jgi:hypothetical protein